MNPDLLQAWERCREFVGAVCATRDASHGLSHMERVTERSVLLYYMSHAGAGADIQLLRVILVGMLHDVADHKYDDTQGSLQRAMEEFARKECAGVAKLCSERPAAVVDSSAVEAEFEQLVLAVSAISFSKEAKRGMRWFTDGLTAAWLEVRDIVSDADKLEAIGESGMQRCFAYACEGAKRTSPALPAAGSPEYRALEANITSQVTAHFHEKLKRLHAEFLATDAGKFIGLPLQREMTETLEKWQRLGPPPMSLYWGGGE